MLVKALITFGGIVLLLSHLSKDTMQKIAGYKGWADLIVHGSILFIFFGTSTAGLIQAEAAGIFFSIYIRLYRRFFGYQRLVDDEWVVYK